MKVLGYQFHGFRPMRMRRGKVLAINEEDVEFYLKIDRIEARESNAQLTENGANTQPKWVPVKTKINEN